MGPIVLGVVEGDVHDTGKNFVKLMFEVTAWIVYDLGKDIPLDKFLYTLSTQNHEIPKKRNPHSL